MHVHGSSSLQSVAYRCGQGAPGSKNVAKKLSVNHYCVNVCDSDGMRMNVSSRACFEVIEWF